MLFSTVTCTDDFSIIVTEGRKIISMPSKHNLDWMWDNDSYDCCTICRIWDKRLRLSKDDKKKNINNETVLNFHLRISSRDSKAIVLERKLLLEVLLTMGFWLIFSRLTLLEIRVHDDNQQFLASWLVLYYVSSCSYCSTICVLRNIEITHVSIP